MLRLVPTGKERRLTALLASCSSAWQDESGKAGAKKGTAAGAGPETSQPLVGKFFSTGRFSRERPVWFCSSDKWAADNVNQNVVFCGKVFISPIGVVLVKGESMFRKAVA